MPERFVREVRAELSRRDFESKPIQEYEAHTRCHPQMCHLPLKSVAELAESMWLHAVVSLRRGILLHRAVVTSKATAVFDTDDSCISGAFARISSRMLRRASDAYKVTRLQSKRGRGGGHVAVAGVDGGASFLRRAGEVERIGGGRKTVDGSLPTRASRRKTLARCEDPANTPHHRTI